MIELKPTDISTKYISGLMRLPENTIYDYANKHGIGVKWIDILDNRYADGSAFLKSFNRLVRDLSERMEFADHYTGNYEYPTSYYRYGSNIV